MIFDIHSNGTSFKSDIKSLAPVINLITNVKNFTALSSVMFSLSKIKFQRTADIYLVVYCVQLICRF